MTQPAGWFNDPYGRFELRYWDGTAWSEHVSTAGTQSIDPLGDALIIPIFTPATVYVAPQPATHTKQPEKFLDSLGPGARDRPTPQLALALAGGGGALVGLGIVAAMVEGNWSRGSALGAGLLVVALAVALRLTVKHQPDLASAAVGAGVIGLFALGAGIVADDVGAAWGTFVVALLFLAAWVLPGFRGRSIMLGIGTLLVVAALGSATASNNAGNDGVLGDVPFSDIVGDQEVVFLVAAAALFGLVWWLDRGGYFGVATGLIVAALVSAVVGVAEASNNLDDTGAAVLIFAVGMLVCFVGSQGERRATTWWGALLAAVGTVGFFSATTKPDSAGSIAAMLVISGLLLIGGPAVARAIRASRQQADPPT